jgi:hypothetical protein
MLVLLEDSATFDIATSDSLARRQCYIWFDSATFDNDSATYGSGAAPGLLIDCAANANN